MSKSHVDVLSVLAPREQGPVNVAWLEVGHACSDLAIAPIGLIAQRHRETDNLCVWVTAKPPQAQCLVEL